MTCIVGIEEKGKVYIGGDSAGVSGWNITIRADQKVFANGPMIFGFTSSFRMGQLIRFQLSIPECRAKTSGQELKFMCTDFIGAVRSCLKSGGYAEINNNVETGGKFLVGFRGHLYLVDSDFQVARSFDGYMAIGCGDNLALGAIAAMPNVYPPTRIRRALEIAARHSGGVCGPFTIMELKK